jgi:hypothetical protein
MKRHLIVTAPLLVAALFLVAVLAGCGPETEQANQLVSDTSRILSEVAPQVKQVDDLLVQAFNQQAQGQLDAEKASATQAKALNEAIIPQLENVKSNMDQAAGLDVSDAYRSYLQAESSSLGYAIAFAQTRLGIAELLISDPTLVNPGSSERMSDLRKTELEQRSLAQQAEDEANRIIDEHPDEIQ